MDSCMYCTHNNRLQSLMIPVYDLNVSKLYLMRDQSFPGRCVVALNNHKQELCDLTLEEQRLFMDDLAKVALLQKEVFGADKVNYAIFGDNVPHLHVHFAAKLQRDDDFGTPYILCNRRPVIKEEELKNIKVKIKDFLNK